MFELLAGLAVGWLARGRCQSECDYDYDGSEPSDGDPLCSFCGRLVSCYGRPFLVHLRGDSALYACRSITCEGKLREASSGKRPKKKLSRGKA